MYVHVSTNFMLHIITCMHRRSKVELELIAYGTIIIIEHKLK